MDNVENVYGLAPMQLDILLRALQAPELHEYVEQVRWTMRGPFDPAAFAAAWRHVAERHPVLRTVFFHEGLERPVQVVRLHAEPHVDYEDWRGVSADEQEVRFRRLLRADRERDFPLATGPLLRVHQLRLGDEEHRIVWTYHHLVLDGWSAMLCLREVLETYARLAAGEPLRGNPAPPFERYLGWLARQDPAEAERFWREALAGVEPAAALPPRGEGPEAGYGVEPATLTAELSEALREVSRRLRVSLNTVFEGAWGLLLARYTGADEAVFGSGGSGRPPELPGAEEMLGVLLRAVPVRVRADPAARVGDWLAGLQRRQQEARLHDFVPLSRIQEWSGVPRGRRLFEHFFLFQNLPDIQVTRAELGGAELSGFERVPPDGAYGHSLMLTAVPRREIALELTHHAALDAASMRRLLEHFRTLLEGVAADPARRVGELGLLSAAERRRVLTEWNDTASAHRPAGVHELFAAQAALSPASVALVSGEERLTYTELDARANRLAHHLAALGAGPERRVALCLERTADMVVGVLATLKAGAAYVPLDPAHPAERLARVLEDSGAVLALTRSHLRERLPASVRRVELDAEAAAVAARPSTAPRVPFDPGNLAYVIYTSGSTGRPKGVLVEHRSVAAFLHAMRRATGMSPDDVLLSVTTLAFDIAGLELFLPLTAGARVVLADRATAADPRLTGRALDAAAATVMQATPATWRMLLDAGWEGRPGLRALCGGEALDGPLAERLLPGVGELWNLYGPTEATVWSTAHRVAEARGAPPIGRPLANTRAYVLDPADEPVPAGVPGELHLGGAGVARGYHGRAELTAERFVPDALSGEAGARLYRTGDRVRWLADGALEFLGRMDRQVKVRGFRIEPGEIEAVLAGHPAVRECAVVAGGDAPGEARLVAYVALRAPEAGTAEPREFLRARLPEYMVPGAWVTVDAIPLTPSGKLDRAALPRPDAGAGEAREYLAPRTSVEETLAAVWAGVLGVERVGVRDDFLDLGGHSLLAVRMAARVQEAFGVILPLHAVFRARTVEALALQIARARLDAQPLDEIEALLAEAEAAGQGDAGGAAAEPDPAPEEQETPTAPDAQDTPTQPQTMEPSSDPLAGLSPEKLSLLMKRLRESKAAPAPSSSIPRRAGDGPAPLSFPQQRLWFVDRMEPGNAAYNVLNSVRLDGALDVDALRRSVDALVERHESLRTVFAEREGTAVQVVVPGMRVPLELAELASLAPAAAEAEAARLAREVTWRGFDLEAGPPMRAVLLRLSPRSHLLLLVVHHIVIDGWSRRVMVRELSALYAAFASGREPSLPPLPIQYPDYAAWQRERMQGRLLQEQLDYWMERLRGAPPALELPTDRPRPALQSVAGATHRFRVPAATAEALRALGVREDTSPFMVFLAAFQTLLARFTGQPDQVVGTAVANRGRPETAELLGFFVNTLPLRTDLSGDPAFRAALRRVRETALGAYGHDELPFERLVEELRPERDLSRPVVFQVSFALEAAQAESAPLRLPGLEMVPVDPDVGISPLELSLRLELGTGGAAGWIEYASALFDANTIARMAECYGVLLEGIAADPDRPLSALPLLPPAERRRVQEWSAGPAGASPGGTVHERFRAQAARTPDALAAAFADESLSFAELEARANRLAHHLRAHGVGPESRVGICLEPGTGLVVAMLAVLKAGGAYLPLDTRYPAERLAYMLDDADAPVLVTGGAPAERLPAAGGRVVVRLDADAAGIAARSAEAPPVEVEPGNLAYVIYTSGSTGLPKGVMVSHAALLDLVGWHVHAIGVGPADRATQLVAVGFDPAALEVWAHLLAGASLHLVDLETRTSPEALRRYFLDRGITLSFVPTPLAEALLALDWPADAPLRAMFVGGDALRARPRPGLPFALVNEYGPTECTVVATWDVVAPDAGDGRVPGIGRPVDNGRAYVLDPQGGPVPTGVPGELFLGGAGVARGYLRRPGLTAERFVPDALSGEPGARLYRTGDRARWLPSGELEFLGRLDQQVKIRGFRIELGEIESVLAEQPEVADAVVAAREDVPGDRRLAAYVVPAAGAAVDAAELRRRLAQRLPEYMVPSAVVAMEALPLTPNGKVDRRALPAPDAASAGEYVAPRTPTEAALAGIFAEVLGLERVGAADGFFALGGHSLLAMRIVSRMRETLGVEAPVRWLFELPTVAALAERLDGTTGAAERGARRAAALPIPRRTGEGPAPLSFGQQRLWFVHQLDPHSRAYNMPAALRLRGALEVPALRRALSEIVRRHGVLRTVFGVRAGEPVQTVRPAAPVRLPVVDLSALPAEPREAEALRVAVEEAVRPFDLERGVMRAVLVRLAPRDHAAICTTHHVASDAWSMDVLVRELSALYAAFARGAESPLPEPAIQYADYAAWQREQLAGEALEARLGWWRERLAGAPPLLEIPTDRPRPPVPGGVGALRRVELSAETTRALRELARREGATLFMALLAAWQLLLSRWSGQDDVSVGTPITGRTRAELEGLIGFFVNTLVVRADLSGDPTFRALLGRVREATLGAFAHQDVPFERLVEEFAAERTLTHTPLFQAMFDFHAVPVAAAADALRLEGLEMAPIGHGQEMAKFDLSLAVEDEGERLAASLVYRAELFEGATAERILGHFAALVDQLVADPDRRVGEAALLAPAERARLLAAGRAPREHRTGTVHARFSEQAGRTPDAPAVESGGGSLTYAALEDGANRLARHLRALGVGPETRVGICLEPGTELVVAQLAVLKAGGAYLPLDPAYPPERLAYMLADAAAPVLVTRGALADRLPADAGRLVVRLDADAADIAAWSAEAPPVHVAPENLAYVVYTSGSTGRPKGVMVSHAALLNLAGWHVRAFGVTAADRATQLASSSFDAAVWETWPYLLAGARLYVVDAETRASPEALRALLLDRAITLAFVPTPLTEGMLALEWPADAPLRVLLTGGDALRVRPRRGLPFALVNDYGPTEVTVAVTSGVVAPDAGDGRLPPIGRPVDNARLYVLDRRGGLVPAGVPGELYAGGPQVARGYLGRPELTAERFVPDPFAGEPGARTYRTGDRARWLPSGELEFLGRVDRQVKVRGFRIEPGEVEAALAAAPGVREAAAEVRGGRLVGYVVPAEGAAVDPAAVRARLRTRLPDYMVPAALVVLDRLPLTPGGKLDRRALPAPERVEAGGERVEPSTPTERLLAGVWAEVLGVEDPAAGDDFFALGGHSLLAAGVVSRVRETVGVALPVRALFEAPTLAELARRVDELRPEGAGARSPIEVVPRGRPLPVSTAQGRLWLQHQLSAAPESYNLGVALRLRGPLAPDALRRALEAVVARHEALRTRFVEERGEPVQVVEPATAFALPVVELSGLEPASREARVARHAADEAARPFDLERAPLLRGALLRLDAAEHVLLVTAHHVAFDGWSAGVLTRELREHYAAALAGRAAALPPLEVQYGDYAAWERTRAEEPDFREMLAWWGRELAGAPAAVELPADWHRPPVQRFRGASFHFRLEAPLAAALDAVARRQGATRFMALLAGFQALLHRIAGQEDLVVGTPVAGRAHPALEGLIGFFVNVLPIRVRVQGDEGFGALLRRVRAATLDAYAHQEVSLEQVVDAAGATREASRSPLVQVLFALQNTPGGAFALAEVEAEALEVESRTSRYELSVYLNELPDGGLSAAVELDTDLFSRETVERWMRHYRRLLEAFAADAELPVAAAPLLGEAERRQILREWNRTALPVDHGATVPALFEAQALRTPDALALVAGTESLSYAELHRRAARLAAGLSARGVGPEACVGLLLERSPEMVAAMLGVLAAGAAYVPLDPAYPDERLAFMLADSGARVLLTQAGLAERVAGFGGEVVLVDGDAPAERAAAGASGPGRAASPDSLAYVIYTSGSTGRPKGVAVAHRNVVNFFAAMTERVGGEPAAWLALTSIAFDISVLEILWTLTRGSKVVLHSDRAREAGSRSVAELVRAHGVTHLQCTPSHAALLAADPDVLRALGGVRCLLLGGEALPAALAAQLRAATPARILNMYGPTETTVWSAAHEVVDAHGSIPIGAPVANTEVYVVDGRVQPVPPGVAGELLIGGAGVVRGYLGRPELTAERFVPDPFGDRPGGRLYRTGDLARWRADGTLEFLGRADQQLKVRGHRIEPGEVESALDEHPAVRESVVVAEGGGEGRLVAYFVPAGAEPASAGGLRRHLAERLPDYMVPSLFVPLDSIPLTPNGKVDREALPAAGASQPALEAEYVPPRNELEALISGVWREVLGVERVGVRDNFFELGGTSVRIAAVHRALGERLDRPVAIVDLFRYPTVAALAEHLGAHGADRTAVVRGQGRAGRQRQVVGQAAEREHEGPERIAVVGMAARFPGAPDVDAFWRNLRGGVESIVPLDDEQLLAAGADPEILRRPDYVRVAAVLEGADLFDPDFFDLTPRDAELMDPQHRLFLEQAWRALEHAGVDPDSFAGPIGVFAGTNMNSYLLAVLARHGAPAGEMLQAKIRSDKDFLTTLASYKLNLRGPSYAVQTACSTSLVATHIACQSLLDHQCDVALAGGVSVSVPQEAGYQVMDGVLSPDGHCRAFDARGAGAVAGSGVGVVVLKRLSDALADGDHVHAVILGSAVNNDGAAKVGYTAPSVEGQIEVIATAQALAGVPSDTITYVEAHGTATPLGDPVEVTALTRAFDTDARGFCALGSVKTNIGHLDAAAGVAGLIKTVLAVEHGEIPPSLHFERPNPAIDFAGSPFFVADRLLPWSPPPGLPRRAGVSSFGIGGTNAHVVLEEPPREPVRRRAEGPELLVLSARTAEALEGLSASLAERLESPPEPELADVAFTLRQGRRAFPHRRALVAASPAEAAALLRGGDAAGTVTRLAAESDPGVAFLFSGLGTQYAGMGRGLYESEPAFREAMDRCFRVLRDGWGMDLREVLYGSAPQPPRPSGGVGLRAMLRGPAAPSDGDPLQGARWGHPAMFAVGYALAEAWRSRGIEPRAVAGHSLGEYVAACVAGVFTLEDALTLVVRRAELLEPLRGGMAAATLSEAETRSLVDELAAEGEPLWLAAVNAPRSCVVSGTDAAVERFAARARALGAVVLPMAVRHPFHSGLLEPVREEFARVVASVRRGEPRVPLAANATGDWLRGAQARSADYWVEHLVAPVRWDACVDRLRGLAGSEGEPVLLELGPGGTLGSWARQQGAERAAATLPHAEQGDADRAVFLRALGQLWSWGVPVDWRRQGSAEGRRRVVLPGHPMNRRRYWLADPAPGGSAGFGRVTRDAAGDDGVTVESVLWRQLPEGEPGAAAAFRGRRVVVFGGAEAGPLAGRLAGAGAEVVRVEAAGAFGAEGERFSVRPGDREDLSRLAAALRARGWRAPVDTLHLWSLCDRPAAAAVPGVTAWLAALAEAGIAGEGGTLLAATRGAHAVLGSEEARPWLAPLSALLAEAAREHRGTRVRAVDVEGRGWEAAVLDEAATLLRDGGGPAEVARRGRMRWEPFRSPVPAGGGSRLREGGVYLVVGGLDGVGLAVAGYLAERFRARLALVDADASGGTGDEAARRAFGVEALRSLGAEVQVLDADPSDACAPCRAVARAREHFGALHGVVLAAGGPAAALALDRATEGEALDLVALVAPAGAASREDAAVLHALAAFRTHADGRPTVAVAWEGEGAGGDAPLAGISAAEGAEVLGRVFARGAGPRVVVSVPSSEARAAAPRADGGRTGHDRPAHAPPYVEPRTELESAVAELYGRALGIGRIGAEDDFWELGGDSLLATQLLAALNERYRVELPLATLFEAVTPARLAVAIVKKQAEQLDGDLLARALAEL